MRPLLEREGGKRRMRGGYQEEKALCKSCTRGRFTEMTQVAEKIEEDKL